MTVHLFIVRTDSWFMNNILRQMSEQLLCLNIHLHGLKITQPPGSNRQKLHVWANKFTWFGHERVHRPENFVSIPTQTELPIILIRTWPLFASQVEAKFGEAFTAAWHATFDSLTKCAAIQKYATLFCRCKCVKKKSVPLSLHRRFSFNDTERI